MNFLKTLAGVAAFVVALALAILLTRYYGQRTDAPADPPRPHVTVTDLPQPPPPPPNPPSGAGVTAKPSLISVDYAAKKSYTTLALERDPARPAPQKVWVWTYFFAPGRTGEVWSGEPEELDDPLAGKTRQTVTVTSACRWCDAAGAAAEAGLYARVRVSSVSKEDARLPRERLDFDIKTATPVVIQHAQRRAK